MSRQVSYSLAVKGNNIAKGSVMLILANLNATTIHSLLSSRNIMAVCFGLRNVPIIGIIVSTQSQPVRKIDWPNISRQHEIICLLIRYSYAKCKLDLTPLDVIDWLLLFTTGKIKNWYCLFLLPRKFIRELALAVISLHSL